MFAVISNGAVVALNLYSDVEISEFRRELKWGSKPLCALI
jgi:hypothetical protein